jgi:hypothetical protein
MFLIFSGISIALLIASRYGSISVNVEDTKTLLIGKGGETEDFFLVCVDIKQHSFLRILTVQVNHAYTVF